MQTLELCIYYNHIYYYKHYNIHMYMLSCIKKQLTIANQQGNDSAVYIKALINNEFRRIHLV